MILDDGRRYELIDGMPHVNPVPGLRHQEVVAKLIALPRPFAVRPGESTELQPDFLVARVEDFTEEDLPVAPLPAVDPEAPSLVVFESRCGSCPPSCSATCGRARNNGRALRTPLS